MYPKLKNSRVRGIPGDYYLQDVKEQQEYVLEEIHTQILLCCNGSNSIKDIADIVRQPQEDIQKFLCVFNKAGLLDMNNPIHEYFPPLTKAPYLREVQIDATGHCNLFGICKHCYGKTIFEKTAKQEFSNVEMQALIDELAISNVGNCFLSGGEVFLRKDLPELIHHLANKYVCLDGIFTNGTVWRQEVIDAVVSTSVKTAFFVSIDGHTPMLNDFMRGQGSFEKTLYFARRIKESNLPLVVNTMVTKQTVGFLEEMYHFMEDLGVRRWRLSVPREQGEAIVNKELIMPSWEEIFIAYERILRISLSSLRDMKIQLSSLFKTEFITDGKICLFRSRNNCCEYKRSSLTIKPNGDIVPCPAFDDLLFGNVREQHLLDIWYSDFTQSFKTLPISAISECRDCDIMKYCGGGCRKIAYQLHRDVLTKDDYSCLIYRFFTDTILPLLQQHGIKLDYLSEGPTYHYDPTLANKVLSLVQ